MDHGLWVIGDEVNHSFVFRVIFYSSLCDESSGGLAKELADFYMEALE